MLHTLHNIALHNSSIVLLSNFNCSSIEENQMCVIRLKENTNVIFFLKNKRQS